MKTVIVSNGGVLICTVKIAGKILTTELVDGGGGHSSTSTCDHDF